MTVPGPGQYTVDVHGEYIGTILSGYAVGVAGSDISIDNPNMVAGHPYFFLDNLGWGLGWQIGEIIRFNTEEAGAPLWVARVINARASTSVSDSAILEVRGDVA